MNRWSHLAILLVLAIGASGVYAATETAAETEAKATFKSLYGEEVTRATRTPSTVDDVKLAGKLLDAVGASRDQPELLALICSKAYDLGKKNSDGYDVAIEAMNVLSTSSPDEKPQCLDKVVSLHQLRYTRSKLADRPTVARTLVNAMIDACDAHAKAGNIAAAKLQCLKASRLAVTARLGQKEALQAKYKELVAAERIVKRIVLYKARLKASPSQLVAREALINIYLIEKNDPAEAARWLNEDCDERLRTYIPMVTGDINAIAETTLVELGDWYKSLAASAQPVSKGGMLIRAKAFYEAFIEKHTAADLARTKAILALTRVKADIKKYRVKVPAKVATPATGSFAGVSRKASVLNPPRIPGLKAWTVEPRAYLGRFNDVEFSKDAATLITAGQDGAIRFWDVETGKLLRVLMAHDSEVRALAWSSDRKTLASASYDKTIRLWNPETGKVTKVLRGSTVGISHLAWSPDSARLASAGRGSSVQIWSMKTGKVAGSLKVTDGVRTIAWGTESGVLATGAEDGNVSLWNVRTGRPYGHYPLDQYKYKGKIRAHRVHAMAWSPAGTKILAVGFSNGKIKLWKSRTKIFTKTMMLANKDSRGRTRTTSPNWIEWSPDGRTLAVSDYGGYGGLVWFWNAATGKMIRKVRDGSNVRRIAWSPDGKLVATAVDDSTSSIIESETGEAIRKIQSNRLGGAARPDFSADGKFMAYSCGDKTIRIWDIEKCQQTSVISLPSNLKYVTIVKWSPDATKIAVLAHEHGAIRIVDVKSGVVATTLGSEYSRLYGLVWSPDSSKLFASEGPRERRGIGKIQAWDVAESKALFSLTDEKISTHYGLAVTSDGKTLASTASRGRVYLWNLAEKKLIRAIPADRRTIRGITFSPDGKKLATCGEEKIVKIWSVDTGKPLFGLQKHESEVYRVDFSPDGTKLASAGHYGSLGIWDLATGKNIAWFRAPNWQVRWMRDSKTLAAANKSGVYFYDASKGTRKASYRPMPNGMGVLISAGGHYSGTDGVEKHLIYQAVGLSGQSTLSQEEFAKRFGWKNDPSKVKLFETVAQSSK
jgi:WD40 repeat protein